MTIVGDIIDRADQLARKRKPWEKVWLDTVRYALPMGEHAFSPDGRARRSVIDGFAGAPRVEQRGRDIYDSTSVWSVERLTAGLESLTTPATDKWHGLKLLDPLAREASHEEREWFDRYRDFLFAARYEPRSGFAMANQQAMRSAVALGTGVYLVEEAFGSRERSVAALPLRYRSIPLSECFIATDAQGEPDTLFRRFSMTARQMVQKFGDAVADKVKAAADDAKDRDRAFDLIHAVYPREERGAAGGKLPDAPFASAYVDVDHRHLIGEAGFFEFPYVVYYWAQDPASGYGESPVMLALAEIKSLNLLSKHTLRAAQQWTNPPLALAHDGVMRRPDMNPGAINLGGIDGQGRARIQPLVTAQNPTFIQQVLEVKREQLRECLFVNLFQILAENPQMTATEALIRANEKGELLSPAGARIQAGLSRLVERETGILERKGTFHPTSPLAPPASLGAGAFGVSFRSPLDRLRRANELLGIERTLEFAGRLAAFDPAVLDRLDTDRALDLAQEINGAPNMMLRSDGEVALLRGARAAASVQMAEQDMQATEERTNDTVDEPGIADAEGKGAERRRGTGAGASLPEPV